jgi:hypothetical protein
VYRIEYNGETPLYYDELLGSSAGIDLSKSGLVTIDLVIEYIYIEPDDPLLREIALRPSHSTVPRFVPLQNGSIRRSCTIQRFSNVVNSLRQHNDLKAVMRQMIVQIQFFKEKDVQELPTINFIADNQDLRAAQDVLDDYLKSIVRNERGTIVRSMPFRLPRNIRN